MWGQSRIVYSALSSALQKLGLMEVHVNGGRSRTSDSEPASEVRSIKKVASVVVLLKLPAT